MLLSIDYVTLYDLRQCSVVDASELTELFAVLLLLKRNKCSLRRSLKRPFPEMDVRCTLRFLFWNRIVLVNLCMYGE